MNFPGRNQRHTATSVLSTERRPELEPSPAPDIPPTSSHRSVCRRRNPLTSGSCVVWRFCASWTTECGQLKCLFALRSFLCFFTQPKVGSFVLLYLNLFFRKKHPAIKILLKGLLGILFVKRSAKHAQNPPKHCSVIFRATCSGNHTFLLNKRNF